MFGHAGAVPVFDTALIWPPPTRWQLPDPRTADADGVAAIGADLDPGTLHDAYSRGMFPMPAGRRQISWWSPDPRGIIPLDGLVVSTSLRKSCRRFEVRFNTCFREVMTQCGDPRRPHGWINREFIDAFERLHTMGWAHSVEVFDADNALVGGLYGVKISRFFAGESMFSTARDASKVALVALLRELNAANVTLFDVQWTTSHLTSMGAVDVSRERYLELLEEAIRPA